jgi:cytochrome c peroxidase
LFSVSDTILKLSTGVILLLLFLQASLPRQSFDSLVKKFSREKKLAPLDPQRVRLQAEEIQLGKELFSDVRFSRNKNIACATCHLEKNGFGNGQSFSVGTHGQTTKRHVPHLFNLAWQQSFFWDGRVSSLEEQLKAVIASKDELDMTIEEVVQRLNSDTALVTKFRRIYPTEGITKKTVSKSIIQYELSLQALNSRYDRFLLGDTGSLRPNEKRGLELFLDKAGCINCHFGQNLSDGKFHNVGVITDDKGRHPIDKIGMANEFESRPYPFFSNFKAFKTPTLRNLSLTAPYFHNGSKATLREVLDFYNQGGDNSDRTGVAKEIKPLHLSSSELDDLEAFLMSLTGEMAY